MSNSETQNGMNEKLGVWAHPNQNLTRQVNIPAKNHKSTIRKIVHVFSVFVPGRVSTCRCHGLKEGVRVDWVWSGDETILTKTNLFGGRKYQRSMKINNKSHMRKEAKRSTGESEAISERRGKKGRILTLCANFTTMPMIAHRGLEISDRNMK